MIFKTPIFCNILKRKIVFQRFQSIEKGKRITFASLKIRFVFCIGSLLYTTEEKLDLIIRYKFLSEITIK